jgi:hypothetical protein
MCDAACATALAEENARYRMALEAIDELAENRGGTVSWQEIYAEAQQIAQKALTISGRRDNKGEGLR